MGQAETPDTGGVDDPAGVLATGQPQRDRLRRGVPPLSDAGHHAGRPVGVRHQAVDQGGLAHTGMPDQCGEMTVHQVGDRGQWIVPAADHDLHVQVGELGGELRRIRQIRLRQADHRGQTPGERGDQRTLDEPGARRRISDCGDDEQLVGIGDHDTLIGVRVIGGTAQDGLPVLQPHDAGQGPVETGGVADHGDPVTDDDGGTSHLPGAHADRRGSIRVGAVDDHAPASPVLRHDHAGLGVLVGRSVLCPRPGPLPRADLHIGFVVTAPAHIRQAPTICAQRVSNPGRVFVVVVMSSTCTPSVTRPRIAPAVAIRWSA